MWTSPVLSLLVNTANICMLPRRWILRIMCLWYISTSHSLRWLMYFMNYLLIHIFWESQLMTFYKKRSNYLNIKETIMRFSLWHHFQFSGCTTWLCILTSSGYPASSALQRWAAPWTSASDHTSSSPPYCASHRPNLTAEPIPFKNTAWDKRVWFIILSCNNSIFIRLHNDPF